MLSFFLPFIAIASSNSKFLFPLENSKLMPNENYDIAWNDNMNSNLHLELEIYMNNKWKKNIPSTSG